MRLALSTEEPEFDLDVLFEEDGPKEEHYECEPVQYACGVRLRRKINIDRNRNASVISRTVPISKDWNITVWEWEKPAAVVETYWQVEQQGLALTAASYSPSRQTLLDPFGLISWPGAVVAAQEMQEYEHLIRGKKVLILGSGVGIEAQAAASLGAGSVLATDIHPTTLKLLEYGAKEAGFRGVISTRVLDLFSVEPLPDCDFMIVADVLYNDRLGAQVAKRCLEVRKNNSSTVVLIADSQRFVREFEKDLNQGFRALEQPRVAWVSRWLPQFTGSGVLIDTDQTYSVKARIIWIGLNTRK
ncbi:predicted protein [Phaeodactylum tricornutum CCAP 1055/1]|jgi:predicted nicotinamide N-methyase|uniref:ETFB lysine methyltransferase n=2 Tax=Phaeodactylum tricornutum TaxID=2850 RepID=B7G783_PHATC|nr:predicted protein [Phaeodactylum tricornutum CCAP 1055/1]EEC45722.1 predicted protein [Phaeodactylum tricornutum CCAP 1055/1]|eukprot:XP_002182986.1 predicted protein [Phaeodactylum tricornutum CCAP 1055/1]